MNRLLNFVWRFCFSPRGGTRKSNQDRVCSAQPQQRAKNESAATPECLAPGGGQNRQPVGTEESPIHYPQSENASEKAHAQNAPKASSGSSQRARLATGRTATNPELRDPLRVGRRVPPSGPLTDQEIEMVAELWRQTSPSGLTSLSTAILFLQKADAVAPCAEVARDNDGESAQGSKNEHGTEAGA